MLFRNAGTLAVKCGALGALFQVRSASAVHNNLGGRPLYTYHLFESLTLYLRQNPENNQMGEGVGIRGVGRGGGLLGTLVYDATRKESWPGSYHVTTTPRFIALTAQPE